MFHSVHPWFAHLPPVGHLVPWFGQLSQLHTSEAFISPGPVPELALLPLSVGAVMRSYRLPSFQQWGSSSFPKSLLALGVANFVVTFHRSAVVSNSVCACVCAFTRSYSPELCSRPSAVVSRACPLNTPVHL